jgi:hypothetical protein
MLNKTRYLKKGRKLRERVVARAIIILGSRGDVSIFENGKYYQGNTKNEDRAYEDLGAFIKEDVFSLEWGRDWRRFVDKPHYQLATDKTVAEVRALFEKGKSYA